ncbi:MAG TPA: nickel pincer cofactor biosynthesis protein LarC [Armatimonadota bacterium]|jgi:hypothetical protein
MRIAYLEFGSGISGDMFLGALVDAGAPVEALQAGLGSLQVRLEAEKVKRGGLQGTLVHVRAAGGAEHVHETHHHPAHRSYQELADILAALELDPEVLEQAQGVLRRLGEAESVAHGVPVAEVHFHEIGGLDTLADILGTLAGLRALGIEKLYAAPLPLSHGQVQTAHGLLPVPPPAVMEIVRGVPTVPVDIEGETVTPTGAALVVALSDSIGPRPAMTPTAVGYGAGTREFPGVPNLARLVVGEAAESCAGLEVRDLALLETNVDDMNPELEPELLAQLFAAGALDAWLTPIQMKKGRPALLITALASPPDAPAVTEAMLRHSTSFGVRVSDCRRHCLPREMRQVQTPWGPVRVKVGLLAGERVTASPEYEDCAARAKEHGVPVRHVYAAALGKAMELGEE